MAHQAFDNKGTITADPTILGTAAGTINVHGTNWTNDGTIQAQNGDSLILGGTAASSPATHAWTNDAGHTISITGGGTLILDLHRRHHGRQHRLAQPGYDHQQRLDRGPGRLLHLRGPGHLQPHRAGRST